MDFLTIGKPAINIYLPLQEFPQEGDIFTINKKYESLGNVSATSACVLSKWGMKAHFTGVVGNDASAEMIRNAFMEYKVDTKYLEANYETKTSLNYNILDIKTGSSSRILYNDPAHQLTRYRYDFIPKYAIIDGTDYAGALALLNNNSNCFTCFYGRVADKDAVTMSKRCSITVCTENFARGLSRVENISSATDYVNMYQHIVDIGGNSNYIVILNNHKILYSVEGKVKMLPEMKINVVDYSSFDSVFTGALVYSLANNMILDDAIKFANTAAAISISKIGEVTSIPELDEVLDNSGLREKLGKTREVNNTRVEAAEVTPIQPNTINNQASVEPSPVVTNEVRTQNINLNQEVNTQENIQYSEPTPMPTPEPLPQEPTTDSNVLTESDVINNNIFDNASVFPANEQINIPSVNDMNSNTQINPLNQVNNQELNTNINNQINNQGAVYSTPVQTANEMPKENTNIYDTE